MPSPKYERIPIQSKKSARKLKHKHLKKKMLKIEKKRVEESLAKIGKRAIDENKINSAMQELKKRNPDFAQAKRVEQMLKTEIGDLQATVRKLDRIIRIERELGGLDGVVAGLPYQRKKNYLEGTIKVDQKLLKNIEHTRTRKERFQT